MEMAPRDYVQFGVFALLGLKFVLEALYGPSRQQRESERIDKMDRILDKMHERASDEADRIQAIIGPLEVTVAEHSRDILHNSVEIARLWDRADRHHRNTP